MKLREKVENKKNQNQIKEILHSYLSWLYYQNNHFADNLTTEELVNFFTSKIHHEEWLKNYLKRNPIGHMAHIYEFIDAYKKEANLFHYTTPIKPLLNGPYREVKEDVY